MSAATVVRMVNHLIEALPDKERTGILQRCEPVNLALDDILCQPDQPHAHVYFPLTGLISTVAKVDGHQPLDIRLIGNEGMLGVTLLLGINAAQLSAVVKGPGKALRMSRQQFKQELHDSPALLLRLNTYLYVVMAQLSRTVGCVRFHEVKARLARYLLMTHDRAQTDHFHLTHEHLADMLGVRRSGVTIAAGELQQGKLIRYTRGEIRILNRKGLEAVSCTCYQAGMNDYARLLA